MANQPPGDYDRREHGGPRSEDVVEDAGMRRQSRLWRANNLVWFVLGVIEVFIGFRVILKLLAANPGSPFADFVYTISRVFVSPFFGLTAEPAAGRAVLEIPSIIAMLVYAIVGVGIERLLWVLFYRQTDRSF